MALQLEKIMQLGPFAMNCYLLVDQESREVCVIDPGDEPERILKTIGGLQGVVKRIVLTHAHIDHVLAVSPLLQTFAKNSPTLHLPQADEELYSGLEQQCRLFGLPPQKPEQNYQRYQEGQQFEFAQQSLQILHTPGHTPGSSCLYLPQHNWLFAGDLVFQDSIGRTDLWGGDLAQMEQSLKRLLTLPESTEIFPGHGPTTTLKREKQHNFFLRTLQAGGTLQGEV